MHNLERSFLCHIITCDNPSLQKRYLEQLGKMHFQDERAWIVFESCCRIIIKGTPVNLETVGQFLFENAPVSKKLLNFIGDDAALHLHYGLLDHEIEAVINPEIEQLKIAALERKYNRAG